MGLFSKVLRVVGKVAPLLPGVGGVVGRAAAIGGRLLTKAPVRTVAKVVGVGAGFEVGSQLVQRRIGKRPRIGTGDPYYNGDAWRSAHRKRRTGLSGRDIQGAQKVARLVRAFGYKPKVSKRKGRR